MKFEPSCNRRAVALSTVTTGIGSLVCLIPLLVHLNLIDRDPISFVAGRAPLPSPASLTPKITI